MIKIQEEIEKDEKELNKGVEVYLLCTDTVLSVLAGELIQEYFENHYKDKKNPIKEVKHIDGLKVNFDTDKNENIDTGLINLINEIKELIELIKNKNDVILNITGGYKALIPFLTIMGQLYEIDIKYIYEDSESLITIPQLPIGFDWISAEKYFDYININKDESKSYKDENSIIKKLKKLEFIMLNTEEKTYKLKPIGILYRDFLKEKYQTLYKILGHHFEYKYFEYFNDTYLLKKYKENEAKNLEIKYVFSKYLDSKVLEKNIKNIPLKDETFYDIENIERSVKTNENGEIDILLSLKNKSFILIEVKSYSRTIENPKEIIDSFKKNIQKFKETFNNSEIKQSLLCLYSSDENTDNDEKLQKNLNEIKSDLPENFKVYCYYFDKGENIPYNGLMSQKINKLEPLYPVEIKKEK